jgi:hypothetical protein
MDFYYHNENVDKHIEKWFSEKTMEQIPSFPQKVVPRFARARMLVYKRPPERDPDYSDRAYMLDSKMREFSELTWLTGAMGLLTVFDDEKERLQYQLVPFWNEYYLEGDSRPFGISYPIGKDTRNNEIYAFWSEEREGLPAKHFEFDQAGNIRSVNEGDVNPYGIIPVTIAEMKPPAYDVVRAAIHLGIAMTEIALAERFGMGQPVAKGIDQEAAKKITMGIDKLMGLPEGADFSFVGPPGDLRAMVDVAKAMTDIAAMNNHLRIRWADSGGNPPSGEALKILELENLEVRESDLQIWREVEKNRYEVDRTILETHGKGQGLTEEIVIDFAEVQFPLDPVKELEILEKKKAMGIITQEDIIRHYNPDISDKELKKRLGEVEKQAQPPQPQSPLGQLLGG